MSSIATRHSRNKVSIKANKVKELNLVEKLDWSNKNLYKINDLIQTKKGVLLKNPPQSFKDAVKLL